MVAAGGLAKLSEAFRLSPRWIRRVPTPDFSELRDARAHWRLAALCDPELSDAVVSARQLTELGDALGLRRFDAGMPSRSPWRIPAPDLSKLSNAGALFRSGAGHLAKLRDAVVPARCLPELTDASGFFRACERRPEERRQDRHDGSHVFPPPRMSRPTQDRLEKF
jgi:hypothetical protein